MTVGRHSLAAAGEEWWRIVGPGHMEGTEIPEDVDPDIGFFDVSLCGDDCPGCMCHATPPCGHCERHVIGELRTGEHHASSIRSPWGNEFTNPTAWCRDRWCESTNWGGRGRLHLRFPDCPLFNPLTVQVPEREQLAVERGQDAGIRRVNP